MIHIAGTADDDSDNRASDFLIGMAEEDDPGVGGQWRETPR